MTTLLIVEGQERPLRRHGAGPEVETQDNEVAYANVPPSRPGALPRRRAAG